MNPLFALQNNHVLYYHKLFNNQYEFTVAIIVCFCWNIFMQLFTCEVPVILFVKELQLPHEVNNFINQFALFQYWEEME